MLLSERYRQMKEDVKTLGLISRPIVNNWGRKERSFGYETRRLIQAGREIYGNVVLINPFLVSVELPRRDDTPQLVHDGRPLGAVHSLIIRSTRRLGDGLTATVRCLALQGCDILDPLSRQGYRRGGKLTTSIRRFKAGVGTSTYFAFSRAAACDLAEKLKGAGEFPLIAKPVDGSGGRGVVRIESPEDLLRHINNFYRRKKNATLLLQPFEEFVNEYRVIVFFGQSLGIVQKTPAECAIAANAAQGGTFEPADRPDIVKFALEEADKTGILGVDVGETKQGGLRIIEANRAPRWQAFDETLGCNTARKILILARERLKTS